MNIDRFKSEIECNEMFINKKEAIKNFKYSVITSVDELVRRKDMYYKDMYKEKEYPEEYLIDQDYKYYTEISSHYLVDLSSCLSKEIKCPQESYDSESDSLYMYYTIDYINDFLKRLEELDYFYGVVRFANFFGTSDNYFGGDLYSIVFEYIHYWNLEEIGDMIICDTPKSVVNYKLAKSEIYEIVNDYIEVHDGYLGDFSYRTHSEFYPYYCDLDIKPNDIKGTTREKFIKIIENEEPSNQAKILKGILKKYPVSFFTEEKKVAKQKLFVEIQEIIKRLEEFPQIPAPELIITSEVVERAINDAKVLVKKSGAISGLDRIHTVLHGYLKAVCCKGNIAFPEGADINQLFKILKGNHPAFQTDGNRKQDIDKILMSLSNIINTLNPIRNNASVAHPNDNLLEEGEAMLVINTAQTLLHYLNTKFR